MSAPEALNNLRGIILMSSPDELFTTYLNSVLSRIEDPDLVNHVRGMWNGYVKAKETKSIITWTVLPLVDPKKMQAPFLTPPGLPPELKEMLRINGVKVACLECLAWRKKWDIWDAVEAYRNRMWDIAMRMPSYAERRWLFRVYRRFQIWVPQYKV
jgi:hypothetical protein